MQSGLLRQVKSTLSLKLYMYYISVTLASWLRFANIQS